MVLDTFNPYLFVSAGEQSNKFLTPTYADGIAKFQAQRAQSLTGLTVRIDPIQEGTGDPSPTNIRPISGRTGLTVTREGKNLLDVAGRSFGQTSPTTIYAALCTATKNGNTITVTATGAWSRVWFGLDTAQLKVGQTYTASALFKNPSGGKIGVSFYDGSWHNSQITTMAGGKLSDTFQYNGQSTLQIAYIINNSIGYTVTLSEIQLEAGGTVTQYTPYVAPTTYHVSWQTEAGTIYGGTLDVISGVLTVTDALIASYDGETLPSTWISDRDVYVAGTTPTTGAQVVYKLATPQTYRLTGAEVRTIAGFNQIYSDAGPIIGIKF